MLLVRRRLRCGGARPRSAITHDLCSRRKHGRQVRRDRLVAASWCEVNGRDNGKIEQIRKCEVRCSSLYSRRELCCVKDFPRAVMSRSGVECGIFK